MVKPVSHNSSPISGTGSCSSSLSSAVLRHSDTKQRGDEKFPLAYEAGQELKQELEMEP